VESLNQVQEFNRRHFLGQAGLGLGAMALGILGSSTSARGSSGELDAASLAHTILPQISPRAKRIIYLFQSGAPSQIELLDHKQTLNRVAGIDLPESVRMGQRLTGMTAGQSNFPIVPSKFAFSKHGESGAEISELLPHTASVADELCIVRSMQTEAINHDPAITFCQTGSQLAGRPSIGAWVAYGLGSVNSELPAYVVLISRGTGRTNGQPLYDRLWGTGFLPSSYQGVKLRSTKDPVLYLANPAGCSSNLRRKMLDDIAQLNEMNYDATGDPEVRTRIQQYELAFRMQTSVPELTDVSAEPKHVIDMYGPEVQKPGTFARNCLLARKLVERDVRFVQLFHMGWDQHANLPDDLSKQCHDTDQASAALIADLRQRGLLDDTLVVWGGEFGRTVYCQGKLEPNNYGRDHHPRCFTIWMAGGGIRAGHTHGQTDEFSYNVVENPIHVHDLNATVLHLLGLDHKKLTYRFQGRDFRLTDVHGRVAHELLS
jgi:hypothetical protein